MKQTIYKAVGGFNAQDFTPLGLIDYIKHLIERYDDTLYFEQKDFEQEYVDGISSYTAIMIKIPESNPAYEWRKESQALSLKYTQDRERETYDRLKAKFGD
jgi:hypothetical protein